jgi:predicted transcriptional regulator
MKSILLSIKPKYVADILNGKKTIEIRKTCPKCDLPIDVYIYCSKGKTTVINMDKYLFGNPNDAIRNGKVVAKFTLRKVEEIIHDFSHFSPFCHTRELTSQKLYDKSCLSYNEIDNYLKGKTGYALHIEDLVIFDKPKELSEFHKIGFSEWCAEHPPILSLIEPKKCYEELKQFMITKAPQSYCFVESEE